MPDRSVRFTWEPMLLQLRNPFGLAYGTTDTRRTYWLKLSDDEGWGEAAIPPYYGIPESAMVAYWAAASAQSSPFPDDPADIPAWTGTNGPAPARCAVDLALHDRIARARGITLHTLLGLSEPPSAATCFTIALAAPDEMARRARDAADFPILKIKLGSNDDQARLAAVREARPDARLQVDANGGWEAREAVRHLRRLERDGVELVEQPVARDDFDGLAFVQAHTHLPVIADESVRTLDDLERLARLGVQGVNVKLQRLGGLAPALAMARRARELGMKVMLGCMIETSLGATAAAHLAGLADWLDLDAPLLIANDPFDGVRVARGGHLEIPGRAGIGVQRRAAMTAGQA